MPKKLIFVDAIKAATEKAVLLEIEDDEYWCPRSLIEDGDEIHYDSGSDFVGTSCELYVAEFWCEENEL